MISLLGSSGKHNPLKDIGMFVTAYCCSSVAQTIVPSMIKEFSGYPAAELTPDKHISLTCEIQCNEGHLSQLSAPSILR